MAYSRQPAAVAAAQCGAICAAASDDLSATLRLSSATSRGRAGRTRTHWEPGAKVRGRRRSGALPGLQHVAMRAEPGPASDTRRAARWGAGPLPWTLTFSYGRALQETALNAWGGKSTGYSGGQQALFVRAKLNGLA